MLTVKNIQSFVNQAIAGRQRQAELTLRDAGDFKGLSLRIKSTGSAAWRWQYTGPDKKRKMVSFGAYPAVSLAEARLAFNAASYRVKSGRTAAPTITLTELAQEWFADECKLGRWKNEKVAGKKWSVLRRHLLDELGALPVAKVTSAELFTVLKSVEGNDTRDRVANFAERIFARAEVLGVRDNNPMTSVKLNLPSNSESKRLAGITDPDELSALLKKIEAYNGPEIYKIAIQLHIHTGLRNSELRTAQWAEIDGDEWTIPAGRMKLPANGDHWIPLTPQVQSLLSQLRRLHNNPDYLFPARNSGNQSPFICDSVVNRHLKIIWPQGVSVDGKQQSLTTHGFRETLSTLCNDSQLFSSDVIETQLHHTDADQIRRKYNHAEYRSQRRELLNWWSAELEALAK